MHALSLVWKVRFGLVALFVLLIAGLTNRLRAAPSDLGCLVQRADYSVFNLETGVATQPPGTAHGWVSPDKSHVAWFDRVGDTEQIQFRVKSLLVAEPVQGKVFHKGSINLEGTKPLNGSNETVQLAWSPDSRWLAFRYTGTDGNDYIGLTDSGGQRVQAVKQDTTKFHTFISGLSDTYLALYTYTPTSENDPVQVTFLAVPNLKTVWTDTLIGNCANLFCGVWSPNSQRIAYILYGTIKLSPQVDSPQMYLLILKLDTYSRVVFPLTSIDAHELLWSPNGEYLSFVRGIGQLGIFSVDGSAVSNVASPLYQAGPIPYITWAKDSSFVFYTQNQNEDRLVTAYYVREHRYLILATGQSPVWVSPSSEHNYAVISWNNDEKTYVGTINMRNGQKTALMQDDSSRLYWGGNWIDKSVWLTREDTPFAILINADGSNRREIKISGERFRCNCYFGEGGPGGPYLHLDYVSPDKKWLLLHTETKTDTGINSYLWLVNVATGKYRQIAQNYLDAMFSPDSRTIAVRGLEGDKTYLMLIPLDGSAEKRINTEVVSMVWSPDGSKIGVVYVAEDGEAYQEGTGRGDGLQIFARDGSKLREYNQFPLVLRERYWESGMIDALTWLPCK